MKAVDIAFVGCLLIVLVFAVSALAVIRVAHMEPTPVPFVTPTPFLPR